MKTEVVLHSKDAALQVMQCKVAVVMGGSVALGAPQCTRGDELARPCRDVASSSRAVQSEGPLQRRDEAANGRYNATQRFQ